MKRTRYSQDEGYAVTNRHINMPFFCRIEMSRVLHRCDDAPSHRKQNQRGHQAEAVPEIKSPEIQRRPDDDIDDHEKTGARRLFIRLKRKLYAIEKCTRYVVVYQQG